MFTHLHVHTIYSLLDGMNKVKELVAKVKSLGQTAVAITDHGVMYGAVKFFDACKSAGIKPIIGCEVYVAPTDRFIKEEVNDEKYYHLILLCKNELGYKNLCKLVTRSNTEGLYYKPRIDFNLLKEFHDGLICLSACVAGEVPSNVIKGDIEKAKQTALKYKDLFGEDYYLEIQNHGLQEEILVRQELTKMSAELGIKLVATNDCHYLNTEDAEAHEWLLAMQTKKTMNDPDRLIYSGDYSVLSEEEMRSKFPSQPEAIENTQEIVDKCNFEFVYAHSPAEYRMPKVVIPEIYGTDYFGYIKDEAYKGLDIRYPEGHPEREQAIKNLDFELGIIKQMGFAEYFLDTRKTILWARENGILVGPGRGSGAGSTLNYCLAITDLDPIKYGLLFERFLNPERVSMPDIDVDYCYSHKDDVIKSEADSNGIENFCKIQTLGSMKAKCVVRDVARVAGYEPSVGNKIAKMIPNDTKITLSEAYAQNPDLQAYITSEPGLKKVWDISLKIEGLKKSAGTHACGHVPVPVPCEDLFPCSVDKKTGYLVCQYDMAEVEHLGNLKKDLLMLRNLTIIEVAHKDIKEHYGVDVPFWTNEVLNDKEALKLFWNGETNGVFQFESEGMKKFMKELKPDCFEDIIAGVSLYRPGPMDYIPDYIAGKHNPSQVKYLCPELEPILSPTYGQIVYQEQVMRICTDLAGFSKGRSDKVRKAMGKKQLDVMLAEKDNFLYGNAEANVPGCKGNGIDLKIAEEIWNRMEKFAEYAFNKSHAACYAAISMQTAYLKAHYPAEFFAGLLTSVSDNLKKLSIYILECKKTGIIIHNPDVNNSDVIFKANINGSITYGLSSIRSLGYKIVDDIINERTQNGPFTSISNLVRRMSEVKITKAHIIALTKAGALDSFGFTRASIIAGAEKLISNVRKEDKGCKDQLTFFDIDESFKMEIEDKDLLPSVDEMSAKDLLFNEKDATGLYISGHPFDEYVPMLPNTYSTTSKFASFENEEDDENEVSFIDDESSSSKNTYEFYEGEKVFIGGIITDAKKFYTHKDNKPMSVFQLSDAYGEVKCVAFPNEYEVYKDIIVDDTPVVLQGEVKLDERDNSPTLCVKGMYTLDMVPMFAAITAHDKDEAEKVAANLKRYTSRNGSDAFLVEYIERNGEKKRSIMNFDRNAFDFQDVMKNFTWRKLVKYY